MINRLTFSIDIAATKDTIWHALWDEESYKIWAAVFFEGSYAVSEHWEEGSIVHFLGPDQNGIYSKIEIHVPARIIRFKHIGKVVNGEEMPLDQEIKKWTGASEQYQLIEKDGIFSLQVEIDVMDEHLEFMSETFPKALRKIKSLCA